MLLATRHYCVKPTALTGSCWRQMCNPEQKTLCSCQHTWQIPITSENMDLVFNITSSDSRAIWCSACTYSTETPLRGSQPQKITLKPLSTPQQYPVLFEVTSREQKTLQSLDKAVPVSLTPGCPGSGQLDKWCLLTQSWPHTVPCNLLFSQTAVSHQPCRNSIILETYTSETPLNSAEIGWERETKRGMQEAFSPEDMGY